MIWSPSSSLPLRQVQACWNLFCKMRQKDEAPVPEAVCLFLRRLHKSLDSGFYKPFLRNLSPWMANLVEREFLRSKNLEVSKLHGCNFEYSILWLIVD